MKQIKIIRKKIYNLFLGIAFTFIVPGAIIYMEIDDNNYRTEGISVQGEVIEANQRNFKVRYTVPEEYITKLDGYSEETVIAEGRINLLTVNKGDIYEGKIMPDNPFIFYVGLPLYMRIMLWILAVFFFLIGLVTLFIICFKIWRDRQIKLEGIEIYGEITSYTFDEKDKEYWAEITYRTYDGVTRNLKFNFEKKIPQIGRQYKIAYLPKNPMIIKILEEF